MKNNLIIGGMLIAVFSVGGYFWANRNVEDFPVIEADRKVNTENKQDDVVIDPSVDSELAATAQIEESIDSQLDDLELATF